MGTIPLLEASLLLRPFSECDGFMPVSARPLATLPDLPVLVIDPAAPLTLAQIHEFEDVLAELPTRVDLRNEYYFAPGMAVKSLRMPAGITATGKLHRTEHLSILAEGTLRLATVDGGWVELTAPAVVHSRPGAKRVAHAVTDCTFMTIHATDATTPEALDAELYRPDRPIEGETA